MVVICKICGWPPVKKIVSEKSKMHITYAVAKELSLGGRNKIILIITIGGKDQYDLSWTDAGLFNRQVSLQ